jgi:DNA-binding NarL/FixJ family response regulator
MLTPIKADFSNLDIPQSSPAPASRRFSPDRQKALQTTAKAADLAARDELNLAVLWRELARGVSVIVDGFFSEDRCYLVLALKTNDKGAPIQGRRLEILEAVLGGLRQKHIAIDFKLAPSTVALNSRLGLEDLGVDGKPSRAHPLLMLAAKAGTEPSVQFARCATFVAHGDREFRVVSVRRPDAQLAKALPPAELSVIRMLIEGLSYQEIAAARGTSTRTIANQITAVFRRLRVSGRNELVQRLFAEQAKSAAHRVVSAETLAPPNPEVATRVAARSA